MDWLFDHPFKLDSFSSRTITSSISSESIVPENSNEESRVRIIFLAIDIP